MSVAGVARDHLWTGAAAVALVAGAGWLRDPGIRYLGVALAATALSMVGAAWLPRRARRWNAALTLALLAFVAIGWLSQRRLERVAGAWPQYRAALIAAGSDRMAVRLSETALALRAAVRSVAANPGGAASFAALDEAIEGHPERSMVVYRQGQPVAWSGRIVTPPDTFVAPLGASFSPFYVTLYATALAGDVRAVAMATVNAASPADALAPSIGSGIASKLGLDGFEMTPPGSAPRGAGMLPFAPNRDTLLLARVIPPGQDEARLLVLEQARVRGVLLLSLALLLFIIAAWGSERTLPWRLTPLGVALAAAAIVPLSTLSSTSLLFDPTVYYAQVGGALTANVGALLLAAALIALGLMLVLRSRARLRRRVAALLLAVAIVGVSPFIMRAASRGVAPPPGGVSTPLWLAWELALFLLALALLLGAALAGAAALGREHGLPPAIAPLLAVALAALGPVLLGAPGAWPQWYTALWIVDIAALAFSRPHRRGLLVAAIVAALGGATLTWNAGIRGRVALADRDLSGLEAVEPEVVAALQRLADAVPEDRLAMTAPELLRLYMQSDLVGTGYPVALRTWPTDSMPKVTLALQPMTLPTRAVSAIVAEARRTCERVLRPVLGEPGTFVVLALPSAGGEVTTVTVAPRTRLIPDNPFNTALGIARREEGTAPYALSLADVDPSLPLTTTATRWYRNAGELHGDRLVRTSRGTMRVHADITLRSPGSLVQRATLVVLLDLAVVAILWALSAFPGGALPRWALRRWRRWPRSYRARLTVVLFAFFVLPAVAFAVWSYRRLQSEDVQSRALLVHEALRSYATDDSTMPLDSAAERMGMPLSVYHDGELREASDPIWDALAPVGRFLPRDVYAVLGGGREVYTSRVDRAGETRILMGYLAASVVPGQELVLAAPARGTADMLDQRRRDLGVLVLFVTVLGAMGAFWLSQAASAALAEPIEGLRGAALAIARGEREPPLARRPPQEFAPVFSAFRRMAADLGASHAALEAAQRRTADVLRNVASGVIALAPSGAIVLANPRAESLLGRALDAGGSVADASPDMAERLRTFLAHGDAEEAFEAVVGGRQLQARLTRLSGAGAGAVLTLDDVTELARAQRVLAWGEMARQVAHEIKNPLTPIRLGVQHLRRAFGDPRMEYEVVLDRNVARILSEIDRLDEIARAFSRYGTAPAERRPATSVDLAAVVRDVVELERLGRGDVDWRLTGADGELPALASADDLREVLLNVLENARLAEASRIDVRCSRRDGRVMIEVADDGRGIAAEVLPRIFEPHFSTRTSGSGLGLAISRQLVESWGGAIAIASTEGEGTTVRIELRDGGTS